MNVEDLCNMEELKNLLEIGVRDGISYEEYFQLMESYAAEGKSSGLEQRQNLIEFTKLNAFRMQRLYKTTELSSELRQELKTLRTPVYWLVLTESWCGDAAQNIPMLHSMSKVTDMIDLKLIFRDAHSTLMDHFLTAGARAIPKLIAMDTEFQVVYTWGPRPEPAQSMMRDFKGGMSGFSSHAEVSLEIQKWYAKDKTRTLQREMLEMLKQHRSKVNGSLSVKP